MNNFAIKLACKAHRFDVPILIFWGIEYGAIKIKGLTIIFLIKYFAEDFMY